MAAEFDRKFEAMMTMVRESRAAPVSVRPNSAVGTFSPEYSAPRRFSHDSGRSSGSNPALANVAGVAMNANKSSSSKGSGGRATNFSRARSSSPDR